MYRRERKKTFLGNMYVDGVEVEREAREEDRRKEIMQCQGTQSRKMFKRGGIKSQMLRRSREV